MMLSVTLQLRHTYPLVSLASLAAIPPDSGGGRSPDRSLPYSVASMTCAVTLPVTRVFPGSLLQGYASLSVAAETPLLNVHLKIVGKEQVHAMVDQVAEAKVTDVAFGTVSQDYVYYREIITIAGDLLTRPRRTLSALSGRSGGVTGGGTDGTAAAADAADSAWAEEMYQETHLANTSFLPNSASSVPNTSILVSLEAAATQQHVVLPVGDFVYPFSFAVPEDLPPSYASGVQVKSGDQSTSRGQLVYYVKLYLIGTDGREVASARTDFTVLPMQPLQPNKTFIGCMQHRLRDDGTCVEVRFPAAGSSCGALCGGGSTRGNSTNDKNQLAVTMALASNWVRLNTDRIRVDVTMLNKTAKPIQGARMTLVQQLTFRTSKADVVTSRHLLTAETKKAIACGQKGTITVESDTAVASAADVMPTLSTSGLLVQYNLRVELIAGHIVDGGYTFEALVLAAAPDPELGEPPCGELSYSALPRGRLTRREAYYAVPQSPCATPHLAELHVSTA